MCAAGRRPDDAELEPIIARLGDIARRCESFGSSTDELEQLQRRLELILNSLKSGHGPRGEPLDYRELVRMLSPVSRVFKNLGHHRMAREIDYVDETLGEIAERLPEFDREAAINQPPAHSLEEQPEQPRPASQSQVENGMVALLLVPSVLSGIAIVWLVIDRGFSLHPVLGIGITLVAGFVGGGLVAMAAVSAILGWRAGGNRRQTAAVIGALLLAPWYVGGAYCAFISYRQLSQPEQAPILQAEVAHPPLPTPTATPTPTPLPVWRRPTPEPDRALFNLPNRVERARSALAAENIDSAVEHLERVAEISIDHPTVVETANQAIGFLIERSSIEAQLTRWHRAQLSLAKARQVSQRFKLPPTRLDQADADLNELIRSHRLRPDDTAGIRAVFGKDAYIVLTDNRTRERGTLRGLENGVLLLDAVDDVGAGQVFFKRRIPIDTIKIINVIPQ